MRSKDISSTSRPSGTNTVAVTIDITGERCRQTRKPKEKLGSFFVLFVCLFLKNQCMETTFWKEVKDKENFSNGGLCVPEGAVGGI